MIEGDAAREVTYAPVTPQAPVPPPSPSWRPGRSCRRKPVSTARRKCRIQLRHSHISQPHPRIPCAEPAPVSPRKGVANSEPHSTPSARLVETPMRRLIVEPGTRPLGRAASRGAPSPIGQNAHQRDFRREPRADQHASFLAAARRAAQPLPPARQGQQDQGAQHRSGSQGVRQGIVDHHLDDSLAAGRSQRGS